MARGYKTGGKQRGTPNKATQEALERERIAKQAQDEVNKARSANTKLAKDVLEDYVGAFHNIAAVYQNRIAQIMEIGKARALTDPEKADLVGAMANFKEWGEMVTMTAGKLAPFQSPTFKAIAVMAPPPSPVKPAAAGNSNEKPNDPLAAARTYARLVTQVR